MNTSSENPFRVALVIGGCDIDGLGHVNNVVYVRWIQEAAESHWRHLTAATPPEGVVWVVLRHEIDYRLPVGPSDRVHALTWVGDTGGARSVRHVRILNADEKVVAEAKTTWCLVDAATGLPRRVTPDILSMLSR